VSIDEATDACGRKVANVVIGVLKINQMLSEKSFSLMQGNVCSESHNSSMCFQ
jgi:hypothetical protein